MAKVLVVDDLYTVRLKVELVLRNAGVFSIYLASSGVEALRVVEDDTPDVIVMDLVLSDMDGAAMLHAMRARNIMCPVVAYTAHTEQYPGEIAALGFDAYVSKAESLSKLITVIRALLARLPQKDVPPCAQTASMGRCVASSVSL
jgi:two-component system OmpR family response regulator